MRHDGYAWLAACVLLQTCAWAEKNEAKKQASPPSSALESPADEHAIRQFVQGIQIIKNYYVEPVSDKKIFDKAMRGLAQELDPHSEYLNEQDYQELREMTRGEFGGVGIEIGMEEGGIRVISPVESGPAEKVGIKPGDLIIKINQKSVRGLRMKEAVEMMRGDPGSSVHLTIFRKNASDKQIKTIKVPREKIKIKSVRSKILDQQYGYIRITQFQEQTGQDFSQAIKDLKKQTQGKMKGLVLDLRNNPGGLLDAAIQVSDALIHNDGKGPEELVVLTKGRTAEDQMEIKAEPGDLLNAAPVVVLINEGSASASEIVAGALQDNHRAIILGQKSFGKGTVQTIFPVGGSTALKITTARYYTPSGRSIQARGITPDVTVDDLKVTEVGVKPKTILRESDLVRHLENDTSELSLSSEVSAKDELALISSDYQLYEALHFLKAIELIRKKSR